MISAGLFSFWVGLTIDKEREEFIEERKDGENDDGRKEKLTSQKVGIINKLLQDGGKKKEEKKEFVFTRERISKEEALSIIKDELSLLLSSLNIEGEEKNSIIESSLRKTIINTTRFEAILNTCRLFPKVILLLLLKDKVAAALIILSLIIWFASKIPPSSATGPSLWYLCIALCILLINCLRIPFNLGATVIGDFIFINTYYPKVNSEKAIGFMFIHEFIHQKGREVFGLTEEDGRLVANALTYLYLSEGREEEIIDMFIYSCKSFRYWTENDKKVFKKKIEESMREEFIPKVVIERIKKEPGISRRFKMQLKFGHLSGDEYAFPMELMAALWAIKTLSAYQSGGIPSALKMLLNNLSTQSKEADILNSQKDGGEYNTKSTILLNEINKNSKNGKNDGGLFNEKSNNPFKDEKNRDEGRKQAQKYIKDGLIATFAGFGLLEIAFLLPDYFYTFTILNLLYPLCFLSGIILISAGLVSIWVGLTIDEEREESIEELNQTLISSLEKLTQGKIDALRIRGLTPKESFQMEEIADKLGLLWCSRWEYPRERIIMYLFNPQAIKRYEEKDEDIRWAKEIITSLPQDTQDIDEIIKEMREYDEAVSIFEELFKELTTRTIDIPKPTFQNTFPLPRISSQ
ncbi:MAG: hypothetical protein DRO93_15585 [Candidatus Thorarchaeota archaeon]|nr:MAG: hypothetical protein DRO93_15585 [Candidatus Thorarchaeota archaeon]